MGDAALGRWRACTPYDAVRWLAGVRRPWWIAGGWVVDLHCGRAHRAHADLDVGCFREDWPALGAALPRWETCAAMSGALRPVAPRADPPSEAHSVWCRPAGADAWWLEVVLDEREGESWVYRRCRDVRLPASALALRDARGTPYLRPEVQLLYKAKARRPKDDADLVALLPALDPDARAWLAAALATWQPGHEWQARLRDAD